MNNHTAYDHALAIAWDAIEKAADEAARNEEDYRIEWAEVRRAKYIA